MKKYLLSSGVIVFAFMLNTAKAQVTYPAVSVQEDDMEIWNKDQANNAAKDPNSGNFGVPGWQCLNALSSPIIGGPPHPISVFKDSNTVHSGSYSAKIVSVVYNSTAYGYISAFVPHDTLGVILAGTITATPSIIPGVSFNKRIYTFNFWYQYIPQMNNGKPDTASCTVLLTHHTTQTNVLGGGAISMNATAGWTHGMVPIVWDSLTGNPDTIQVFFSSSSLYKPAPGSILYLDGMTPLNVNDVIDGQLTHIDVYPNPASTEVNFRIDGAFAHTVSIYDMTGKEVGSYLVKDNMLTVNTASYPAGLYLYRMYNKDGGAMKVGKFSIER